MDDCPPLPRVESRVPSIPCLSLFAFLFLRGSTPPFSRGYHPNVETSIRLDQIPPKDLLEEAPLNLIAHVPREEIVYLRVRRWFIFTEAISAQLPYLKIIHFAGTPLGVAFPKSTFDRDEIFPCLQDPALDGIVAHGDDSLITFLDRLASSGNKLDTLEIDDFYKMDSCVEVVRKAVREFRMKHSSFYSDFPFYPRQDRYRAVSPYAMRRAPTSSCLTTTSALINSNVYPVGRMGR